MRRVFDVVLGALAACSHGDRPPLIQDSTPDSVITSVFEAACSPSAPVVSTMDDFYAFTPPTTTITQDGVIEFAMSPTHGVASGPADVAMSPDSWDPGLLVPIGDTKCLQFTRAGTFRFHDQSYDFRGAAIVTVP